MVTHPLWRPYEPADLDALGSAFVGGSIPRETVVVVLPDPRWTESATTWGERVSPVLGQIEHVGSTAVPGLWAKPMIDLDAVRDDLDDEATYVPATEALGLTLRVREPGHRLFVLRGGDPDVNLHVWETGSIEPARHRVFRDWLRAHPDDRAAYADLKRQLSDQGFETVMAYNNAKSGLIYDLYEKIFTADTEHPHDPQPRTR